MSAHWRCFRHGREYKIAVDTFEYRSSYSEIHLGRSSTVKRHPSLSADPQISPTLHHKWMEKVCTFMQLCGGNQLRDISDRCVWQNNREKTLDEAWEVWHWLCVWLGLDLLLIQHLNITYASQLTHVWNSLITRAFSQSFLQCPPGILISGQMALPMRAMEVCGDDWLHQTMFVNSQCVFTPKDAHGP